MVLKIRYAEALRRFLLPWVGGIWMLRASRLWRNANGMFSLLFHNGLHATNCVQDGLGGLEGWRWIFIIFGLMTVAASIIGFLFLVDFPDRAIDQKHWKFLNSDEIAFILRRINKDRHDAASEPWNFKKWLAAGKDWKIWMFAMTFLSVIIPSILFSSHTN